jgi:Immunity protein 52
MGRSMLETYYAGVYWLNRHETSKDCARRAETYFCLLASLDPTWAHWFGKADTLEEALKLRIDPVATTFEALLAQKEYQLPIDGYSLGLWNGEQHPGATSTDFTCGCSSRFVPNVCVLEPPTPARSPQGERIVVASTMTQVLRAMAIAWEPDRGVAMSHSHREMLRKDGKLPPVLVGWVTYLSRRRGHVPPLPAPVRVEPVENLGTLITLTPERFTAANPSHVELATHVRALLEEAGLLAPAQP